MVWRRPARDQGNDDREFPLQQTTSAVTHWRGHTDLMGRARNVTGARERAADRSPSSAFPGKLGHGGGIGLAGVLGRTDRRNPQLLRDGRGEHLPDVLPFSTDARRGSPLKMYADEIGFVKNALALKPAVPLG